MGLDLAALKALKNRQVEQVQAEVVQQPPVQQQVVQQPIIQQEPIRQEQVRPQRTQPQQPPAYRPHQVAQQPVHDVGYSEPWGGRENPLNQGEWDPSKVERTQVHTTSVAIPTDPNSAIYALLGLDPTVEISVVTPIPLAVEPIDFGEIRDRHGKISDRVKAKERELGYSVLPMDVAEVSPNVVEVLGYDIITLSDKKLLSGTQHSNNPNKVEAFVNEVADVVRDGLTFVKSLKTTMEHDGRQYSTLMFNEYELNIIHGRLRNAQPEVVVKPNGEPFLLVGHRPMLY